MIAHRVELVILDFEHHGISQFNDIIMNMTGGQILSHQTCAVPNYEDSHTLNSRITTIEEKRKFFQIPDDGAVYVNREVKPDSELEALVKSLTAENEKLKLKLRRIKDCTNE